MIFYRSFYESIKELPKENQWEIYDAIFSYWIDKKEKQLSWISKTIWILIKPQLDANQKKYDIWSKQWHHWEKGKEHWIKWWRPKKQTPHITPQDWINNPPYNPPNDKWVMYNDKWVMINKNKEQTDRSSFFDDPELVQLLEDFEAMRVKIKKPLTPRARQILSEKLKWLSSDTLEQRQMVENAILNSWQTIYPLKPWEHKEWTDGFYKQEIIRLRGWYEPTHWYWRAFMEKYWDELHKKYYKRYKDTFPENLPPIFWSKWILN